MSEWWYLEPLNGSKFGAVKNWDWEGDQLSISFVQLRVLHGENANYLYGFTMDSTTVKIKGGGNKKLDNHFVKIEVPKSEIRRKNLSTKEWETIGLTPMAKEALWCTEFLSPEKIYTGQLNLDNSPYTVEILTQKTMNGKPVDDEMQQSFIDVVCRLEATENDLLPELQNIANDAQSSQQFTNRTYSRGQTEYEKLKDRERYGIELLNSRFPLLKLASASELTAENIASKAKDMDSQVADLVMLCQFVQNLIFGMSMDG